MVLPIMWTGAQPLAGNPTLLRKGESNGDHRIPDTGCSGGGGRGVSVRLPGFLTGFRVVSLTLKGHLNQWSGCPDTWRVGGVIGRVGE